MKKIICLFTFLLSFDLANAQRKETYLFIGSYTDGKPHKGIYVYSLDLNTGELRFKSNTEALVNPSFLNISPNGKYLYACTETKLSQHGNISSFAIDSINGKLKFINKQSSNGENPVYVSVHKNNNFVVSGNYSEGNMSVFSTNIDGSINSFTQSIQFSGKSINEQRQEKSHIHSTIFSPKNDYLFLPDLGSDKIWAFKFDAQINKPLTLIDSLNVTSVAGSGPRHLTFHPNQKYAYCIEEMSGMIAVYTYHNGKLTGIQRIMSNQKLAETYSSADIHISPDGLFLYASNRVENTISIFSIATNGHLKLVGFVSTFGNTPRNFNIDPSGKFLIVANQSSSNIVVFRRDLKTGLLKKISQEISVPNPSCLQFKQYTQK
jgi:6-phosphogluconolactonase (cycloisomerase 2 family)